MPSFPPSATQCVQPPGKVGVRKEAEEEEEEGGERESESYKSMTAWPGDSEGSEAAADLHVLDAYVTSGGGRSVQRAWDAAAQQESEQQTSTQHLGAHQHVTDCAANDADSPERREKARLAAARARVARVLSDAAGM